MTSHISRPGYFRSLIAALALVIGYATFPSLPADATHTFQHRECHTDPNPGASGPGGNAERDWSLWYAQLADNEGYQWGGGCWNTNDKDDQPNDPVQDATTGGEGGDCSGFTFKTWGLTGKDNSEWMLYSIFYVIHGPYTAASYKNGGTAAFFNIEKTLAVTQNMDAFASSSHIAMIYAEGTSNGQDTVVHAHCESCGTVIETQTYRGQSGYSGVRRHGWWTPPDEADCLRKSIRDCVHGFV